MGSIADVVYADYADYADFDVDLGVKYWQWISVSILRQEWQGASKLLY
jgi:hypothetical protein